MKPVSLKSNIKSAVKKLKSPEIYLLSKVNFLKPKLGLKKANFQRIIKMQLHPQWWGPFVKPGDKIQKGQALLIIEAMKTMNPINAPRAGTVTKILVKNEQPVEFGEELLLIE